MYFEVVGEITDVEVIAVGGNIGDIMRLRRQFGPGRWRKLKGVARVRVEQGGAWPNFTGTELMASAEERYQEIPGLSHERATSQ